MKYGLLISLACIGLAFGLAIGISSFLDTRDSAAIEHRVRESTERDGQVRRLNIESAEAACRADYIQHADTGSFAEAQKRAEDWCGLKYGADWDDWARAFPQQAQERALAKQQH